MFDALFLESKGVPMSIFDIKELTISDVHKAMLAGQLTCKQLVSEYLKIIEGYDKQGPCLQAIVTINHQALERAAYLDKVLQNTGKLSGALHGIPVLLKDNINTHDLPTTAGSLAMENFIPSSDAFITKRLREAGAIILGKTNLHEFAIWGETISSILGQTLNPYDLTRTPGGSSGGTGAAIACNMGLIGIGTDTINSIRSPASACNLVGIRPTMGLVSRSGIVPYSLTQDVAGPICRTVEDAVRTLDCIAAYDVNDQETSWSVGRKPVSYLESLKHGGLNGKSIGVLKSFFGQEKHHMEVNKVIQEAIAKMENLGASILWLDEDIDPALLLKEASVHLDDFKTHLEDYLNSLGDQAPVRSMQDILNSGKYHPGVLENIKMAMSLSVGTPPYNEKLLKQKNIRTKVLNIMANKRLDAIVYPHQQQLVCKVGSGQQERNGVLCAVTGFPSITVPAGFAPSITAPIGVPVGMEIVGRPFSEPVLIEIAYEFEQQTQFRRTPILS